MAKKKKEKVKLIEAVQFDNLERAKRAVTLAKVNQIRILIGFLFAVASTGFTAYGIFGKAEIFQWFPYTIILAIPAYLIGGGIGKALKAAWRVAEFGWFLIPVFPADVLFGFAFLFIGMFGFFCVPVFFVGLNYVQHKKTLDAARSYLAECGYAATTIEE